MSGTTWKPHSTSGAAARLPRPAASAPAGRRVATAVLPRQREVGSQTLGGGWLRVATQRQTWRNALYLTLALPLGLAYTTLLLGALTFGGALLMLLLGVPVSLAFLEGSLRVANLERRLASGLLTVRCEPARPAPALAGSAEQRFAARIAQPANWRALGFLALKAPLGMLTTGTVAAMLATAGGLLCAPALAAWAPLTLLGAWRVDTLLDATLSALLGVLALLLALHALNLLATLSGNIARALLNE